MLASSVCTKKEPEGTSKEHAIFDHHEQVTARKKAMGADAYDWSKMGGSRDELADELSSLCGKRISTHVLNQWLSLGSDRRMPSELDPAWCAATKSDRVLNVQARRLGWYVVDATRQKFAALGGMVVEQLRRDQARMEMARELLSVGDHKEAAA